MKRVITLLAVVLVLAGCNTVAGVGKDVEKAGEAIQKSTK
jgi:predicted small secreted protein